MAFRTVRDIVVVKHTEVAPTQVEWDAYIGRCRRVFERCRGVRALVLSEGGGPNGDQRGDINELFAGRPQRVAVLNASRWVRGVVSALSWFNPGIRAFRPSKIDEAFEHLRMSVSERVAVNQALCAMASELGEPPDVDSAPLPRGERSAPAPRGRSDVP